MDFDAGAKATQWIENSLFNKWCNNTGYPCAIKIESKRGRRE